MECPHCGKEAKIPNRAFFNADQYSKSCVTKVGCCGKAVRISPIRSYRIDAARPADGTDDWGMRVLA